MIQGSVRHAGAATRPRCSSSMFLLEFEGVEQPHAEMHRMKEVRNLVPLSSVPFDVRKSTVSLFMAEVALPVDPGGRGQRTAFRFYLFRRAAARPDGTGGGQFPSLVPGAPVGLSGGSIPATSTATGDGSTSAADCFATPCRSTAPVWGRPRRGCWAG